MDLREEIKWASLLFFLNIIFLLLQGVDKGLSIALSLNVVPGVLLSRSAEFIGNRTDYLIRGRYISEPTPPIIIRGLAWLVMGLLTLSFIGGYLKEI